MLPPTWNKIEDRLWPASELFPYNCGSARRLRTLGTRDPVCWINQSLFSVHCVDMKGLIVEIVLLDIIISSTHSSFKSTFTDTKLVYMERGKDLGFINYIYCPWHMTRTMLEHVFPQNYVNIFTLDDLMCVSKPNDYLPISRVNNTIQITWNIWGKRYRGMMPHLTENMFQNI